MKKVCSSLIVGAVALHLVLGSAHADDFIVNSALDDGAGTLREAITLANASDASADTITFDFAEATTITLATSLPELSGGGPLHISATSGQVILNGSSLFGESNGLSITKDDVSIRGLVIQGFPGRGIVATNVSGLAIGGAGSGEGNIISGNGLGGILFTTVDDSTIAGNRIGLDLNEQPQFNGGPGIQLDASPQNFIGLVGDGAGNLISGNSGPGIQLDNGSDDNDVVNNNIGLTTAFQGIGNTGDGIRITVSNGNTIGGPTSASGNIICSSSESGVEINGGANNVLANNWIGVDPLDVSHPNSSAGISIFGGATGNRIGEVVGAGNIIRRNTGFGVLVNGLSTTGNDIRFNSISNNGSGGIFILNNANGDIEPPVITALDPARGTAAALSTIDLYVDNATQGDLYLATVTATAGGSFSSNVDLTPYNGRLLTAVATGETGSSAFSSPFPITTPEGEGSVDGEGAIEGEGEGIIEGGVDGEGEDVFENNECPLDSILSQPIDATVTDSAPNSFGDVTSYEQFTGLTLPIVAVRWWGTASGTFGECVSETPEFLITFYADDNDFPGEVVDSFTVTVTRADTGRTFFDAVERMHEALLSRPVVLADGWVSIENLEISGCVSNWIGTDAGDGSSLTVDELEPSVVFNTFDLAVCFVGGDPVEGEEGEETPPELDCDPAALVSQPVGDQIIQGGQSNTNNLLLSFEKYESLAEPAFGLRWWGSYASQLGGDCFEENPVFRVAVFEDNAGEPGAELMSQVVLPTVVATGRSSFDVSERVFDVSLSSPIPAGTGWLLIEDLNDEGCIYRWTSGTGGDGASLSRNLVNEQFLPNAFDLAYCIVPGIPVEGEIEGNIEGIQEGAIDGEVEGEGEGVVFIAHSADTDGSGTLSLAELLRVIQLYNAEGYRCVSVKGASEDGYDPGVGDCNNCGPHDADFDGGADCTISLSELLRVIQFFNTGSYAACESSEDGFCAGV